VPGGKGMYCVKHKTADMVDVKNKRCVWDGCDKQPAFDVPGGKGMYCVKHKTADMVDVKNKQCAFDGEGGCKTGARYGKPGLPVSHCAPHRLKGMIRKSNATCANTKCRELAVWGSNWVPKHCEEHKTVDEDNLVERQCRSCPFLYVLDKNDHCENCDPTAWVTARLAKQNALMSYLDTREAQLGRPVSTDRAVGGGECGADRPDRIYDFGDKIIVVECDEDQHRGRACLCEQTRMVNIGQSFGGVPVYFVRWNPDDYAPKDHRKNPELLAKRHKLCGDLLADIKEGRAVVPAALVSVIYLYYDDWSDLTKESWVVVTAF
jgi:hypothetical protein